MIRLLGYPKAFLPAMTFMELRFLPMEILRLIHKYLVLTLKWSLAVATPLRESEALLLRQLGRVIQSHSTLDLLKELSNVIAQAFRPDLSLYPV